MNNSGMITYRMFKPKSLLIVFVIFSIFLILGCQDKELLTVEPVIRPVRFVTVHAVSGDRIRTFSGVSQAALESKLSFRVKGTIQRLYVKVGDRVKSGQRIASLDNEIYTLQMQEAKAALSQAKAQVRSSTNTYKRIQQLYVNKNASQSELDSARAQFESMKAAVLSLEKRLEQMSLQLSYTRLYAPVNGAIAAVPVEVNENIMAGQPIVILSTSTDLEVSTVVPEALITNIKKGSLVEVSFDALEGQIFTAIVTEVAVSALNSNTAFPIIVKINKYSTSLRPGMAAEVSFKVFAKDTRERFVLPTFSLSNDGDKDFVYIVTPTEKGFGKVNIREVVTGGFSADGIIIYEGLKNGDKVLTAGVSKVHDGLIVRMPE